MLICFDPQYNGIPSRVYPNLVPVIHKPPPPPHRDLDQDTMDGWIDG